MQFKTLAIASLPVLSVAAAPQPPCTSPSAYGGPPFSTSSAIDVTTTTLSLTLTITSTYTKTGTTTATTLTTKTSAAPQSTPTNPYGLISARSASPVHLLPWGAAGQRFYLGGNTASYCPESVNKTGSCPPGKSTVFSGLCAMDVLVPGGQQLWVAPNGEVGYTQAHSASRPEGAHLCPFAYNKPADTSFGYITLDPAVAFGATSFMACPTDGGHYQVFASLKNATVPKGNISECLGFSALSSDYPAGTFGAWQYT